MTITLDSATEERIQRELARGVFKEPAQVIAHALDLLDNEQDWLRNHPEAETSTSQECGENNVSTGRKDVAVESSPHVQFAPRFKTLAEYLAKGAVASSDFMENVEELPMQERDFF